MAALALPARLLPPTFALYVVRLFLVWFCGTMGVVSVIILAADIIQFLADDAVGSEVGFGLILLLAFLKLPQTAQQVMPFAVLASGLGSYSQLTRSSELIVARASGLSVWQFLLPAVAAAFLLGLLRVAALDPLAASLMGQYEALRSAHFQGYSSLTVSLSGGVWLREQSAEGGTIVHARSVDLAAGRLERVTILRFDGEDHFVNRLDAASGVIGGGQWQLSDVREIKARRGAVRLATVVLPTRLSFGQIVDRFANTNSISFWQLPSYAATLEATGFSGREHWLLWHRLLATPFLYLGLVLVAAAFALRLYRRGEVVLLLGTGALTGFLLYFFSDLVYALGINSSIPLGLSAWAPTAVTGLLGIALLLHLEDG
jgi:lipopolysaccharide export system permease protein